MSRTRHRGDFLSFPTSRPLPLLSIRLHPTTWGRFLIPFMTHSSVAEIDDHTIVTPPSNGQNNATGRNVDASLIITRHDCCTLKSPKPPPNSVAVVVGSHSCRQGAGGTIESLPSELLLVIFLLLQHPSYVIIMGGGSGMDWLLVTQVCSLWRRVAIGAPWLWANVPTVFGPEWMRLALDRSKMAPINLHFFYPGLLADMEEEVLSTFSRIKYLSLSDDWHVLQCFLHKMVKEAPNIEDLRIDGVQTNGKNISHRWDMLSVEHKGREVSFPPDLLGGFAPHLRHLELCRSSFPGAFPIFRELTFLQLRDVYPALEFPATGDPSSTVPSPRLSLSSLLTFLENTPALITLRLTNAFEHDASLDTAQRTRTGHKVQLLCLQTLCVEAHSKECILLLDSIAIPAPCFVDVRASHDDNVQTLCAVVSRVFRNCSFTHAEVLFNNASDDEMRIGFHPEFFHPPNVWYSCHSRVGLECLPQHHRWIYRVVIFWVFSALPGLRSIAFDERAQHVLGEPDFAHFLCSPNLDGVHTIRLTFFNALAFCTSLRRSRVVTLGTGERVLQPMLKGLKTLVIGDNEPCEFFEADDCEQEQPRLWHPGVEDALADLVQLRRQCNLPLERLMIKGYWEMDREFMDALRTKVGGAGEVQIEEIFLPHIVRD